MALRVGERPKYASFSLKVKRCTDQQSNFLNRTQDRWYNGPIEVEDQNQNMSKSYTK